MALQKSLCSEFNVLTCKSVQLYITAIAISEIILAGAIGTNPLLSAIY